MSVKKKYVTLIFLVLIFGSVIVLCDECIKEISLVKDNQEWNYKFKLHSNQLLAFKRYEIFDIKGLHEKFKTQGVFGHINLLFNETVVYITDPAVYNVIEQTATYFVLFLDIIINVLIPNGMILYLFLCVMALIIYKYVLLAAVSVFFTFILNTILSIEYAIFIDRFSPSLFNSTDTYSSTTIFASSSYFRFKESLLDVNPADLLLAEDAPGNRDLRLILAEIAIGFDNMLLTIYENFPYVMMIADSFVCVIFHFGACGANFGICELLFDKDDGLISVPLLYLDDLYIEDMLSVLPQIPDAWLSDVPFSVCSDIFRRLRGDGGCPCEACKLTGVTLESFKRTSDFLLDLGFENTVPCNPFGQCCLIAAIDYHYYDSICVERSGDWYTSIIYVAFPAQFVAGAGQFELIVPGYCSEHYLSVFEMIDNLSFNRRTIFGDGFDDYNLPELKCGDNKYIPIEYWPVTFVVGYTYYDAFVKSNIQGLPFPFSLETVPAWAAGFGAATGTMGHHTYDTVCEGKCTNIPNLCVEMNLAVVKDSAMEIQRDKSCGFLMASLGYCFGESQIDNDDYRSGLAVDPFVWDNYQNSRLTCPGGAKIKARMLDRESGSFVRNEYMCDLHYMVKWGLDSHWKSHWIRKALFFIPPGTFSQVFDGQFGWVEQTNVQYILDFLLGDDSLQDLPNITSLCDIFFSAPEGRGIDVSFGEFTAYTACVRDFSEMQEFGIDMHDNFPLNQSDPWYWTIPELFRSPSLYVLRDRLHFLVPGTSKHEAYMGEHIELNQNFQESYGNQKYSMQRLIENMTYLSEDVFNSTYEHDRYVELFFTGTQKETIDYYLNHVTYLTHLGQGFDCTPYDYKEEFALHFSAVRAIQRSTHLVGWFLYRAFVVYAGGWTAYASSSITSPATVWDHVDIFFNYMYDEKEFDPTPGQLFSCDFEREDQRIRAYKLWKMFTGPDIRLAENDALVREYYSELLPWIEEVLDPMGLTDEDEQYEVLTTLARMSELFTTNPATHVYSDDLLHHQFYVNDTYILHDYVLDQLFGGSLWGARVHDVTDQFCFGDGYVVGDSSKIKSQWPIYICSAYNMMYISEWGIPFDYEDSRFSRYDHLKYLLDIDGNTCEVVKKFFQQNYNWGIGAKVLQNYENLIEFFDCV